MMTKNKKGIGVNIDAVFNMHKVKFTDLDSFLLGSDGYLETEKPDVVRIFINLEMVYRYIIGVSGEEAMFAIKNIDDAKKLIISNVINLAQHYRLYFAKLHIPNQVYVYWNYNPENKDYKNTQFIYDYRDKYDMKIGKASPFPYLRDVLSGAHETLKTIMNYVNEVYLITHSTIESSVIPYMFYRDQVDDKKYMNLLISRDAYDYQYALYGFYVIDPKKYRVVTESSILVDYSIYFKWKSTINLPLSFVPSMMAIYGDSNKGIDKIKSVGIKGFCELVKENIYNLNLTQNTSSLEIIETIFKDEDIRKQFRKNYQCTCIPQQYQDITPNERFEIFSQVIDKYDDINLAFLNERFFSNYPLMIIDEKSRQFINEGNL